MGECRRDDVACPARRDVVVDQLAHHRAVAQAARDGVVESAVGEREAEAALGLPEKRLVPERRRQHEHVLAGRKAAPVELRGEERGP